MPVQAASRPLKSYLNSLTYANARLSRAAMSERAASGMLPGCAPTGYLNRDGGVALDPAIAPLVREAMLAFLAADIPVRALLVRMSARGLVSRGGRPMGTSAFWYLLANPFYAGYLRRGGRPVPGKHEPLISIAQHEAILRKLRAKRRSPGRVKS